MAIYLAVIAILLGCFLHNFVDAHRSVVPEWLWWIEVPGPVVIYLALRKGMDEWGWSWPVLHVARVVRIPNLNGQWNGTGRTSHDDMTSEYDCTITIKQNLDAHCDSAGNGDIALEQYRRRGVD